MTSNSRSSTKAPNQFLLVTDGKEILCFTRRPPTPPPVQFACDGSYRARLMLSVLRLLTQRLLAAGSPERRAIEVRASVYVCVWVSIAAPVLRPPPLRAHTTASRGCSSSSHLRSTIPEQGPTHQASAAAAAALMFPLPQTASSLYTCQP